MIMHAQSSRAALPSRQAELSINVKSSDEAFKSHLSVRLQSQSCGALPANSPLFRDQFSFHCETLTKSKPAQTNTNHNNTMAFLKSLKRRRNNASTTTKQTKGRKSQSLLMQDDTSSSSSEPRSLGGTYFTTMQRDDNPRLTDSSSCSEDSWKASSGKGHHKHSPLVAKSGESISSKTRPNGARVHPAENDSDGDDAEELGMIMLRSQQLPGTWYYSSNHVLVNKERVKRRISPLVRRTQLDELARQHAETMAAQDALYHSNPTDLVQKIGRPSRRLGENVSFGESIRDIHKTMMTDNGADRNNVLDRRYLTMGMGTARGPNGGLYMCQIFRG